MNKIIGLTPLLLATLVSNVAAEMIGLNESTLEGVSGQSGIGVNIDKLISIESITYSDEDGTSGGDLQIQKIKIGNPSDINTTAYSQHRVDVDGVDGLFLENRFDATRVQIGGISVGNHIGSRSMGEFIFDFEGINTLNIAGNTMGLSGFLINSTTNFTNVSYQWNTNGNTFRAEGITIDNVLTDAVFEEKDIGGGISALVIEMPTYTSAITVNAACFNAAGCMTDSLGSFSRNLALKDSYIQIYGGGREGEGISMNMHFEYDGTSSQSTYTDDASINFGLISGLVDIKGLTFDIGTAEANIGDHIALQVDQVIGNYKIGNVEIAGTSVGEFEAIFDFTDGIGNSAGYQNKTLIAPGIAFAGQALSETFMTSFYAKVNDLSDGVSVFNEWNMTGSFIYTDNNHSISMNNVYSYGSGYVTLDLRSGGTQSIDSTNGAESFLAIGIKDYNVNYGFDGFVIGEDAAAQQQSGYELLGLSPQASFNMNAAIEIRSGGTNGSGVTFDGDVLLNNANFALTRDSTTGNGIYLDDAVYDFHFRDVTFDVDSGGIQLVIGEMWSEFTVNDVRFGDSIAGASFGGLVINRYQTGSTATISGGGAGIAKCIGGTGTDLATCTGNWIDPESQGLTIATTSILQPRNGTKENSFAWEANRTAGAGTGVSIKADNIYTSDGYGDTANTYGIQTVTSIDVAKTRVLKKFTGTDLNGVIGNEGDELIVDSAETAGYKYVTAPTDIEKSSRATGLIISNNVQIKELNIESIQLIHPTAAVSTNTLLHGMKLQNLNMSSTLSVTPIR
jgi:hypothetical protein